MMAAREEGAHGEDDAEHGRREGYGRRANKVKMSVFLALVREA
jgi:hypothetical protein